MNRLIFNITGLKSHGHENCEIVEDFWYKNKEYLIEEGCKTIMCYCDPENSRAEELEYWLMINCIDESQGSFIIHNLYMDHLLEINFNENNLRETYKVAEEVLYELMDLQLTPTDYENGIIKEEIDKINLRINKIY